MNNYIASNKIFMHPDRIKAYLNNEPVMPISVKLRLTDNCNLRCKYCSYRGDLKNGEMSIEDLPKILKRLKELQVKSIVLTGGEPTFYYNFYEALQMIKKEGFDVGLITNGVVFGQEFLEHLTWIRFSLDTVDREAFKEMKQMDSLKWVMENIQVAAQAPRRTEIDTTIGVQAVVNKDNFDYKFDKIIEVIKFAKRAGADYVQIRPLENYKYSEDEIVIIKENLDTLDKTDYGIKLILTEYKWSEVFNGYRKEYPGCPSADFIGMVDTKGDFYMCCAMTNDQSAKYGNLVIDDTQTILNERKFIQKKFDYKKCTLACQGALLNQTLYRFKNINHVNFI